MPELPEVETTRAGVAPYLIGAVITQVITRTPKLRWPIPPHLASALQGRTITQVIRRAKYLLLDCGHGWLIIHLGMSGSLRILPHAHPAEKHDHFDLVLSTGNILRLRDPRRFGCVLWEPQGDWRNHPLLSTLGPEPLEPDFSPAYLHAQCLRYKKAIKPLLMEQKIVVGVGNIYANESLFLAGIHPETRCNTLSLEACDKLYHAIIQMLQAAILAGGSTLRDFVNVNGQSGYFQQNYFVYGRAQQACRICTHPIESCTLGQRTSFYCSNCQPKATPHNK